MKKIRVAVLSTILLSFSAVSATHVYTQTEHQVSPADSRDEVKQVETQAQKAKAAQGEADTWMPAVTSAYKLLETDKTAAIAMFEELLQKTKNPKVWLKAALGLGSAGKSDRAVEELMKLAKEGDFTGHEDLRQWVEFGVQKFRDRK